MKNNIFKILVLAVFSTSPLFCYANNTIMIKGNIVEDTCSTKSNEIECTATLFYQVNITLTFM
ncbi:hypothetical protein DLD53_03780 [Acinetobacter baumannii]|nr:hypothetical protein DLD53_03780 [Acinetobacter baumannii]